MAGIQTAGGGASFPPPVSGNVGSPEHVGNSASCRLCAALQHCRAAVSWVLPRVFLLHKLSSAPAPPGAGPGADPTSSCRLVDTQACRFQKGSFLAPKQVYSRGLEVGVGAKEPFGFSDRLLRMAATQVSKKGWEPASKRGENSLFRYNHVWGHIRPGLLLALRSGVAPGGLGEPATCCTIDPAQKSHVAVVV